MNRKSIEDYVWKFFHRNTCYSPEFSPCSGNPNYGPPAESSYLYVDTKPITPDHIENTFFKTLLTRKSQREYSNSPLYFPPYQPSYFILMVMLNRLAAVKAEEKLYLPQALDFQ